MGISTRLRLLIKEEHVGPEADGSLLGAGFGQLDGQGTHKFTFGCC
jgi:hypothetical protein